MSRRVRAPRRVASTLLATLVAYPLPLAAAEPSLDFHHGVSQIPNYNLKYPPDFPHFDYVNPNAPKGGTLVLPSTIGFDTVSPMYKPEGFYRAYDHLIERAGDESSGYYASLAESVAISPDRRSIVFRLRPEARWHDGTPITATDVKFSFETFRTDIMASGWKTVLDWIAAVEIVNASEVGVHAKSDVGTQLYILRYIPIVPAHYWGAKDLTEPTLSLPLQSGPYRITEISQGRYMIYERVPDYWGRDLAVNRGKFNFDTIRYERYLDATVAWEALRAGLFDVWTETDLRHWLTSYDVPARDRGWLVQSTLVSGNVRGSRSRLVLNTRRQPFDDPRVRRALAYALDFEWQNRALHSGELTRAPSYFANSMFASRGPPGEAELALLEPFRAQLPDEVFTREFSFARSDGIGVDRDGLSKSRDILAEAGWRVTDGVLVNAAGERFTMEFLATSPQHQRTLLPYARALSVLGIRADIRMIDSTGFTNRRRYGDYDAILVRGFIEVPPSWQLRPYFHSSSTEYWNSSGIDHPAVDSLIDTALGADNIESFVTACRALDRVLLWNYYQIPLDALEDTRIVYWNKFGRPKLPDEMYVAPFPDGWWFDEEKVARIGDARSSSGRPSSAQAY